MSSKIKPSDRRRPCVWWPTLATNLAWSLAQTGTVLLLDADPQDYMLM